MALDPPSSSIAPESTPPIPDGPLPRLSTQQGEARRREILDQAVDVFGELGFAAGRIDDVAERVGIRRPSVLYHFPDKSNLYAAAIAHVVGELELRIRDAEHASSERLDSIADAWVDFVIERPGAARLLLRQMIDAHPTPIPMAEAPTQRLIATIASALEDRARHMDVPAIDATEFSLALASTSLVWVASRTAVVGALGIDTLSPDAVARHRGMLHALIQRLLAANDEDPSPIHRNVAK